MYLMVMKMKDNNYLYHVLEIEKAISNYYSLFLNEASNDYLYENIFSMLEDSKDMAREIYNLLYEKERFELDEADSIKINYLTRTLEKVLEI